MSRTLYLQPITLLRAIAPPLVWASLIFLISSQSILPSFELSALDFVSKKIAHMAVYAVLYALIYRAVLLILKGKKPQSHLYWSVPLLVTLLYAITDELHQSFVPGRFGTPRDVGYDILGSLVVFLKIYRYI